MNTTIESLRLKELAYWVNDFLQDSDAVLAVNENTAVHWRIRCLAKMAFLDCVKNRREQGILLYLHDASSLKEGAL